MSHTTNVGITNFVHNGGFDGDVIIMDDFGSEVKIPIEDLVGFANNIRISNEIEKLEKEYV